MAWYHRLLNLARDDAHARDLDRELAFHVDELTDRLAAGGMSRADARAEAHRRFGNRTAQQERTRDAGIFPWLDSAAADVRYALRAIRVNPMFALVVVLSLGLGIGANTAIFTLIDAVVLRSLPVSHPEELVKLAMGPRADEFTNPLYEAIRDRQTAFSGAFAFGNRRANLATGGVARNVDVDYVSGAYFGTLGVPTAAGRLLAPRDDARGCAPVAVLSDAFWRSEYGGDPGVVGRNLSLDGHPFEIVGVAGAGFTGLDVGRATQVFAPICSEPVVSGNAGDLDERAMWWLNVMARLKTGTALAAANASLAAISKPVFEASVSPDWPDEAQAGFLKNTLSAEPSATGFSELRAQYQQALWILMLVVGVVLLIACANVANLLLARATARQREMAIRLAIGAGRARLVRQLLTESVILSSLGAAVGVLFARWGCQFLVGLLSSATSSVGLDLSMDARVLGFTVAVAVVTGVLFGLAPAVRAARVDPQSAMKSGGRGSTDGRSRLTVAKLLVTSQVALSLVLVMAAGLLVGTFQRMASIDPGFRPRGILLVRMDYATGQDTPEQRVDAPRRVLDAIRATAGVRSAATSLITPISGMGWNGLVKADGFVPKKARDDMVYFNAVSDGYFATMATKLIAGRDVRPQDGATGAKVAVINETMAKKFFPGRSPIGQVFRVTNGRVNDQPVEVVGLVEDAKYRALTEETLATAFVPAAQDIHPGTNINFEIRGDGDPSALIPAVTRAVASVNPAYSVSYNTLSGLIASSLRRPRLLALLSGFFGALALLLAVVGLYGIIAYSVERRRSEIGVRIALGAARRDVLRMVLGEVARVVTAGIVTGAVLVVFATRLVQSFLYGVTKNDPATFAGSAIVLAVIAVAAGALPAWRAARTDPMLVLREE